MNDIDEKLDAIIDSLMNRAHGAGLKGVAATWDRSYREQITRSFIDAGWIKTDLAPYYTEMIKAYVKAGGSADCVLMSRKDYEVNAKLSGLMTGKEWYDRFKKELKHHPFSGLPTVNPIDAAKKAAGLNE